MEKKSPRSPAIFPKSPLVYEIYKTGCACSLIGFFDFRQGHSSKKLVSDQRHVNRHSVGNDCTKSKVTSLSEFDERCQQTDDIVDSKNARVNSGNGQVNPFMIDEISCKPQIKKKMLTTKSQHVQSDSKFVDELSKKHRKTSRKFKKPGNVTAPSQKNLAARSSNKLNMTTAEAFCNQRHLRSGRDDDCKSVCGTKNDPHAETNLQLHIDEATEAFINQKLIDGKYHSKGGPSNHSKHFLDALEILNSNKELFIKLLQDPNYLLVKHIRDLQDSQATNPQDKSSFGAQLKNQMSKARELSEEAVGCQIHNSYDEDMSKGSDGFQHSDTIVLMRPWSAIVQNDEDKISYCSSQQSEQKSGKPTNFSLKNMKKKLKHAIGVNHKELYQSSTNATKHRSFYDFQSHSSKDGTVTGREIIQKTSKRIELDVGVMAKSLDDIKRIGKMNAAKNFESSIRHDTASTSVSAQNVFNSSTFRHPKGIESKLYLESQIRLFKKADIAGHVSDILARRQTTESMHRTTVFPEYDFLSAFSPGVDRVHSFLNSEMRFSPYNYYPKVDLSKDRLKKEKINGCINSLKENFEAQTGSTKLDYPSKTVDEEPNISVNHFTDMEMQESICFLAKDSSSRGSVKITETNNTINREEVNPLEVPCEPHYTHDVNSNQSIQGAGICGRENGDFEPPNMDSPVENCFSTSSIDIFSSSPVRASRVDNSPGMKDGSELPSPVSFLEHIDVEDIANLEDNSAQTAKQPIHPEQINADAHNSTTFTSLPVHLKVKVGSASEYVKVVLQASRLNWDELLTKCHSSGQLLDPSLFDDLEACLDSDQSCCDHKLLFDYINEVLLEVYQRKVTYPLCILLVKRKLLPIMMMNGVVHEAMKCVNWFLLSKLPSQTLDQLVGNELTKSESCMDLHMNAEKVLTNIVDCVLEELLMESATELWS